MAFSLDIKKKETSNKCIRFPDELIDEIDKRAQENKITFSKFVILACEYALQDLKNQNKK